MKSQIIKQNAGADLSKDDFKVSFQQLFDSQKTRIKASRKFANTVSGFKEFVKWITKHKAPSVQVRVTLEATGVYYEQLVHFLNDKTDFHISVLLPNTSKAYFKSLNIKSKTDEIDAKVLGQMGIERNLKAWKPISKQMRTLRQLTRFKTSLQETKTMVSNRLHAMDHSFDPSKKVMKELRKQIRLLDRQIKEMDQLITELVEKDKVLKERIDNICIARGFKLVTIATIVAETDGFVLFTSRGQVMSYAGYDIVQNQSGTSINGKTRISKKGNHRIRKSLFFPAMALARFEPEFQRLYKRVFDRTKIKMKAQVAVQRKALVLIYTLFKKNEPYITDYENQKTKEDLQTQSEVCRQDISPAYAR